MPLDIRDPFLTDNLQVTSGTSMGLSPPPGTVNPLMCTSLSDNGYRECLANGSWAARVNYSQCQEILSEEVKHW